MAIENKFLYYRTKAQFESELENIKETSIVFVEDAQLIYTRGTYFYCSFGDDAQKTIAGGLEALKEEVSEQAEVFSTALNDLMVSLGKIVLNGNIIITKADIGLGNVDNTSDLSKPVSTAQREALDLKVSKSDLKGLSVQVGGTQGFSYNTTATQTIDLTNGDGISVEWENGKIKISGVLATTSKSGLMSSADKTKLDSLAQADWSASEGGAVILNKPTLGPLATKSSVAREDLEDGIKTSLSIADNLADWAKGSSKPTYIASEVGASEQGHKHIKADITDLPEWVKSDTKPSYTPSEIGAAASSHTHGNDDLTEIADWAKSETKPSYSYTEVGAAASSHTHGVSEITDMPAWSKAATKPSYVASEIGAAEENHTHTKSEITDLAAWVKSDTKPTYTASEVGASATGHGHTVSDITDFPEWSKAENKPSYLASEIGGLNTLLDGKVDKVEGSSLMTAEEHTKLSGLVQTEVKGNAETAYRKGQVDITKENIGLGNVDNTSDANKPVSSATQTALDKKVDKVNGSSLVPDSKISSYDAHLNSTSNPHSVGKSDVGLGNVDNTSDLDKPISIATQEEIDKVKLSTAGAIEEIDKRIGVNEEILGEGLNELNQRFTQSLSPDENIGSSQTPVYFEKGIAKPVSFTVPSDVAWLNSSDKTKLNGLAQSDWNATSGGAVILNKPTLGGLASKNSVGESDLDSSLKNKINGALQGSDISDWAKASTKPSYTASEVGAAESSHTHGNSDLVGLASWAKASTKPSYTAAEVGASETGHKHVKADITDFPTSMPASDVHDWAKAESKPSYTYSEVGAAASSHTHGNSDLTGIAAWAKAGTKPSYSYTEITGLSGQLDEKVDKVGGSSLMTSAEHTKLSGIAEGAQVNSITGVKGDAESSYRTGQVNITKANIGLSNVDNTSDANKPISTAQQTALDKKVDKVTGSSLIADSKVSSYDNHLGSTTNPHQVTKSQIGLGDVDNTSDEDKPLSKASRDGFKAIAGSIEGLKEEIDKNALVTTTSIAEIENKVSHMGVDGTVGSSTQPVYFDRGTAKATTYTLAKSVPADAKFTDTTYSAATTGASGLMSATDKSKLDGLKQADWNATSGGAVILNKPTLGSLAAKSSVSKSDLDSSLQSEITGKVDKVSGSGLIATSKVTGYDNHLSSTSNPHSVTKAQVGLGNCDNTSDLNKPVSNAVKAELERIDQTSAAAILKLLEESWERERILCEAINELRYEIQKINENL